MRYINKVIVVIIQQKVLSKANKKKLETVLQFRQKKYQNCDQTYTGFQLCNTQIKLTIKIQTLFSVQRSFITIFLVFIKSLNGNDLKCVSFWDKEDKKASKGEKKGHIEFF